MKNFKILLVDDDPVSLELLSSLFKKNYPDFEVSVISTEQDYLDKIQQQDYDCILLDYLMPKITGLELLDKTHELGIKTPIIILTGEGDEYVAVQSMKSGAYDYIPKEILSEENGFKLLVNKILNVHRIYYLNSEKKKVENEIINQKMFLQTVLDTMNNMVLVYENGELINANKVFLDFFGFSNIKIFKETVPNLLDLTVEFEGYITKKNNDNWIHSVLHDRSIQKLIAFNDALSGDVKIFSLSVNKLVVDEEKYVISMADVTDLEARVKDFEQKSVYDPLTNIYNRRKVDEILQNWFDMAERYGSVFSIIFFDIDDFKNINDTYGHLSGDFILQKIAELVTVRIRKTDFFARWGGEEFIVILPETIKKYGINIAENIRSIIEHYDFVLKDNTKVHVTCSFGVTSYNKEKKARELIDKVDEALYSAKVSGKNVVKNI